jgi:hypothetical protein
MALGLACAFPNVGVFNTPLQDKQSISDDL